MKTKEELNALKEEVEALNKKLHELTEKELKQVCGGGDVQLRYWHNGCGGQIRINPITDYECERCHEHHWSVFQFDYYVTT